MGIEKASKRNLESVQRKPVKAPQPASSREAKPGLTQRRLAETSSHSAAPETVLALQGSVGNRAVQRLLARQRVQAKLTVGPAGDQYEKEADRVAGQVMTMSQPGQALSPQKARDEEQVQTKPLGPGITPLAQREMEDEEEVQTKRTDSRPGFDLDTQVEGQLQATQGSGSPLADSTRTYMEPRFGADFGNVKVHADASAAQLNRSMQARAFTKGADIYFGEGQYQPETGPGQHLLAHELTHVVQQGQAGQGQPEAQRKATPEVSQAGPEQVQRFAIDQPPIPFGTATHVKPSTSGATGVFFVEDDSPTPVVVKASTDPVDVTNFSSLLHGRLGAGKAPTTRAATAEEREGFTALLEDGDKVDQEAWEKYAATLGPNVTVDEAREHRITNFKRNPIMYVMGTAQGKDFRAIAEGKDPHNSVQNLLLNREYLYKLGLVTAIDCFMGNEDRLLSGNLGNWMTGSNFDRDITVIDNVDTMTRMSFGHQYRQRNIELNDPVRRLAPSRINELAQTCVRVMLAALAHDVPDKDWSDLSDTPMFKNRMVEEIQRGLKDGRKRLIKKLTPAIFRKRSRSIKAGVVGGEGQDPQGLWNYIKYRASFLKGQR